MDDLSTLLPRLLGIAWLLPLLSFTLIVFLGPWLGKHGVGAGYVATSAIGLGAVCAWVALFAWIGTHGFGGASPHGAELHFPGPKFQVEGHGESSEHAAEHPVVVPKAYTGDLYTLGQFGSLRVTISYYIDALAVVMFAMITLVATCIHVYAMGYMHDELHDVTDHEVTLSDGRHLQRRGRYHRFFQYMSLFSFSMLGLVYAGNIAMVFVFWELVGICSYFLIGFYIERQSASNAGNKAFIVNRIGDFGMMIGMMALWASLGTFAFGDVQDETGRVQPGIFSLARDPANHYRLAVPAGMVKAAAPEMVAEVVLDHRGNPDPRAAESEIDARVESYRQAGYGYGLLVVAGIGIFCGCVGKSAQFPLHVWLPDAMEGPTPVSALVHSATMVAAGVYLAGRFYPVFAPEALLVVAYVGCITLFLAATIALTATDIKRVLAYSTVSQLGYMMLALGVGGWLAGLFHLLTHAFFKSLLFLCSGSVIHACHTNELPKMGGLLKKMPITAYTMLVGCLAIVGAGVPFKLGFSGYYSKDAIIAQALSFYQHNPLHGAVFFYAAAGGAALTAFYMFRLWYMTFLGEPGDHHVHEHAHESPSVMWGPLVVLAVFAVALGWPSVFHVSDLLEQARPAGEVAEGVLIAGLTYPNEHASHADAIHTAATLYAFSTALGGFLLATVLYGVRWLSPEDVRRQFAPLYRFLLNKWYFDELYDAVFVRPTHTIARAIAGFDRRMIDGLIDNLARWTRGVSSIDDLIDRYFVDGLVNLSAAWIYSIGRGLRGVQTGKLRQYVMLIVIGTVAITVLINFASAR